MTEGPQPAEPSEAGVPERTPDAMQLEAARLLANDARSALRDRGFDDQQIDDWAKTYTSRYGSGSAADLIAWIDREQRS
jgi:hypothetical protein